MEYYYYGIDIFVEDKDPHCCMWEPFVLGTIYIESNTCMTIKEVKDYIRKACLEYNTSNKEAKNLRWYDILKFTYTYRYDGRLSITTGHSIVQENLALIDNIDNILVKYGLWFCDGEPEKFNKRCEVKVDDYILK